MMVNWPNCFVKIKSRNTYFCFWPTLQTILFYFSYFYSRLDAPFPAAQTIPDFCRNKRIHDSLPYQLDEQIILFQYIYYIPLHVSSTIVLIFRNTVVLTQNLVSSLSLGDGSDHRLREDCRSLWSEQSPKESDDTGCYVNTIVLLKMSTVVLETCRGM